MAVSQLECLGLWMDVRQSSTASLHLRGLRQKVFELVFAGEGFPGRVEGRLWGWEGSDWEEQL